MKCRAISNETSSKLHGPRLLKSPLTGKEVALNEHGRQDAGEVVKMTGGQKESATLKHNSRI